MRPLQTRPAVRALGCCAALLLAGCAGGDDGGSATATPGAEPSVASTAAAEGSGSVAVLAVGQVDPDRVAGYSRLAEQAVRQVEQLWGEGSVPRPVTVQLAGDAATFADLTGHTEDEAAVPATTVGRSGAARVVVHPAAWERLTAEGRQAVLTHEVTHLAQQRRSQQLAGGGAPRAVPEWLHEGLAEYTAHRASERPPRRIAGPTVLARLDREGPPRDWPDPTGWSDRWHGYALSWLACAYLAETYGEEELLALWSQAAAGTPLAAALPAVTGQREEQALAGWRGWLAALARKPR